MFKSSLIILVSIALMVRASVIPQENQMEMDAGAGGEMMNEIKYDNAQGAYEQPIVPEQNKYETPYTTPATTTAAYITTTMMTTPEYKTETSAPYYPSSNQYNSQYPQGQSVQYGSNVYEKQSKETCKPSEHLTPVEGNCNQFRVCANGIMNILSCPDKLVFDSHLRICNVKESVSGPCGSKIYY